MKEQIIEIFGHKFKLKDHFRIKKGLVVVLNPLSPFFGDILKFVGTVIGNEKQFKVLEAQKFSRGFVPCEDGMNSIGLLVKELK